MMEENLKMAFEQMTKEYENILNHCLPWRGGGSSGFTEANLTFYYVKNLLNQLNKGKTLVGDCEQSAFAWFEAPIGNDGRIDAVISDYKNNNIILIESKRLYKKQRQKKQSELIQQIGRLNESAVKEVIKKFDLDKEKSKIRAHLVVLADLWEEGDWQRAIKWWEGEEGDNIKPTNYKCYECKLAEYRNDVKNYHLLFRLHDLKEHQF